MQPIKEIDERFGEAANRIDLAAAMIDVVGCDPSMLHMLVDHGAGKGLQCLGESPVPVRQDVRQIR